MITPDDLRKAIRVTTCYMDGAKGMAVQTGYYKQFPRLTWSWSRASRQDQGRITYAVDGVEVTGGWNEIAKRLNEPVKEDA